MATLPSGNSGTAGSLTNATTTAAQQKTNFTNLRDFLADLLGTDSSNKGAARAALGVDAITTTTGSGTAYVAAPTAVITAYAAGVSLIVDFHALSGTSPTLQISGLASPPNLVKQNRDGTYSNIAARDIPASHRSRVTLISATQAWVESLPRAGVVIDRAYGEYAANADLTTVLPVDDTIPQNTEGTQIISISFTPKFITSRLRLRFQGQLSADTVPVGGAAAIFSSASADALQARNVSLSAVGSSYLMALEHEYVPGVITALTFSVRVGPSAAANLRLNGHSTGRFFGGVSRATFVIEEIAP